MARLCLAELGLDSRVVIMLSFLNASETALDIGKNGITKAKLSENEFLLPDVMLQPGAELDPILVTLNRMVWNGSEESVQVIAKAISQEKGEESIDPTRLLSFWSRKSFK